MAVSTNNTSFEDMEGAPTIVGYGGGQGAGVNTDAYIEGSQSVGRRVDNATSKGQGVSVTAVDLSAANVHMKMWVICNHWASVTKLVMRISSGSADDHEYPITDLPYLGGWIPLWVDVSRTPEVGGSANEASINEVGCLLDIGDVGGAAQNLMIDEILYTGGGTTAGLGWTGTGGAMSDFRTFETTNNEGNLVRISGIDYCFSRLTIGDSGGTATTFTDGNFTVVFPDQKLVASDFMGVSLFANNVSSSISLSDCTFQSANPTSATNRPDFLLSQTEDNTTSFSNVNLLGMRIIAIGQRSKWDGGVLDAVQILVSSHPNTEVKNMAIRTRSAVNTGCFTGTFGTTSGVHDCDFQQAGAGHALVLSTAGSITLTNVTFSGYASTNGSAGDEAIWVDNSNIIDANTDESATGYRVLSANESPPWEGGQSFTGTGGSIKRIAIYMRKNGIYNANTTVDIYAHSGTFGTSSVPTGASLGTSNAVSSSTLAVGDQWVVYEFTTPVATSPATNYVWVVSTDGAPTGGPDDIGPIYGSTAGAHAGNYSVTESGSWVAFNRDFSFALFTDTGSNLTINVSGGNSPSIRTSGTVVTVLNSVTWTVEVRVDGALLTNAAEITITDNSATPVELFHVETSVTGSEVYAFDGSNSGNAVTVLVMTDDYEPFDIDTVLPSSNGTIVVELDEDRTYDNPV